MNTPQSALLEGWFGCELRYVEYLLASVACWWGGWLLMPWESFPSTPTYTVMHDLAPEWVWGMALVAAGGWLFYGLRGRSYRVRRQALLALTLLWLTVWLVLFMGNWRSTATPNYIHWALFCAFAYLRIPNRVAQ